jgi:serine/threonine-protein kinase
MSQSGWERLEDLFEKAQSMPGDSRPGFLDQACVGDPVLRAELEAMLAVSDERPLAIERFVSDERSGSAEWNAWLGRSLGPWRLTRVVGQGGMGFVYVAVRADGQYQLEVAVKLMRAGPRDPQAVERFRTERQVLASLKHPHIAGLLDGGVAPDGTPYLVMELVDGVPITDWCREKALSLEARLKLFRVACDAVQHAHGALVVHRDLKPKNIFVSKNGDVKLLDFGIAKLLEPEALGIETSETRADVRVLSPDYAAPEQWHGGPITTSTDVYALGVVLFELITGARPPSPLAPPSHVLRRSAEEPDADIDESRQRRRLAKRVRGDLDRIVLMALREEPERRYMSAGQLGEEIGRFLDGRTVLAQQDTVGYRVRRFVARHRLAVVASAAFVVALAGFGIVSAWQAFMLAEERRLAQLERDKSEQVVRLLIDLFQTTNPSVRPDGDSMPVGEFLEGAESRSLALLNDAPEVRAKLQNVFGRIHATRGQYQAARQAFEEALDEQRRLHGPDHPEALESLLALGEIYHYSGDDERARALLEEALERHRRIYGDDHERTARVLFALAPVVAERDLEGGGALLRKTLAIRRAALGPNHPDVASSIAALATYHARRGELEIARGLYLEALALFPRPQDRRTPVVITMLSDYATLLNRLDENDAAESVQRQAIELGRAVLGAESLTVANLLNNLATTRAFLGRHGEAEASFREAFEIHRSLVGEDHWRTQNVARNVARALVLQERYPEALQWMDRAILGDRENGASAWGIRAQRAQILFRLGRSAEAFEEASAAVASLKRLPDSDAGQRLAAAQVILGRLLLELGRPGEAEPELSAAASYFDRLGADHPQRAEARCELGRARVMIGGGEPERQRLKECLSIYRSWGLAEREIVESMEKALQPS